MSSSKFGFLLIPRKKIIENTLHRNWHGTVLKNTKLLTKVQFIVRLVQYCYVHIDSNFYFTQVCLETEVEKIKILDDWKGLILNNQSSPI